MDTSNITRDIIKSVGMMGSGLQKFNDGFTKMTNLNFDLEILYQVNGKVLEIPFTEEVKKTNELYDSQAETAHKRLNEIQNKIFDIKFGTGVEAILNSDYQNMKKISDAFNTIISCTNNIKKNDILKEDIDLSKSVNPEIISMNNIAVENINNELDITLTAMNHLKETMVIP